MFTTYGGEGMILLFIGFLSLEEFGTILGIIGSIIFFISFFIGIFTENKYNLINRIKRRIAILQNKDVEISIAFTYEINNDFENVKRKIIEQFENVNVKRETKTRIDFNSGLYSINIISEAKNNIFIEIERMGCGIKGLKNKINELLGKLNNLTIENNQILKKFLACDIDLSLPYTWSYININTPKKFNLKRYTIELEEGIFKSQIKIIVDKINIKFNTLQAIFPLLEKFI